MSSESNDAAQPTPETTTRTILVVGATGKQGRSFISAVLTTGAASDIRILALTRSSSSPAATALAAADRVKVVEADLDKPDTVRKVFEDTKSDGGGLWGVFLVLAFPGLGKDTSGEERQGKLVVDLSKEFSVQHLIYSSADRGDEVHDDDDPKLSKSAKVQIERHIKSLDGLRWTILRPTFFMENFDGFLGRITAATLRIGVKDTKIQFIYADDIGHVALAVFLSPEPDTYSGQAITVLGDALTMTEFAEAYERGAGKPFPSFPGPIARVLVAMNKSIKELFASIERTGSYRASFDNSDPRSYEALIARCLSLYPAMNTVEAWARGRGVRDERTERRNNVSVWDLIRGKL